MLYYMIFSLCTASELIPTPGLYTGYLIFVVQFESNFSSLQAVVHIWNSSTLETVCILGAGFFKKAVVALEFSTKVC